MKDFLVIGESCVDVFCYGGCKRLCPEAPAPVFNPTDYKENGGMSKNVYENIIALGYECDIITNDNWKEITKTRYIHKSTNQLFIRVDNGDDKIKRCNVYDIDFKEYKIVIISDYCKGFLMEEDIDYIASNHNCVFLDTKKDLGEWCKNVNFIKINNIEYERTKNMITDKMREKMIITLGHKGCLFQKTIFPVENVEIKDVSGAGDTFLAGLVVKYLESNDIRESAKFANECATKVVQRRGVSTT
tara:strand:+ start:232 stop:966 length:735 start_codon:yes stop_codon:yes gene_type:complete